MNIKSLYFCVCWHDRMAMNVSEPNGAKVSREILNFGLFENVTRIPKILKIKIYRA